jgi:predicted metal-dependent HD superfamily phosphohydrolase
LWFHDAVYNPKASDNEEQSAALAGRCISMAGGSTFLSKQVRDLILATKNHERNGVPDSEWMLDIDLSIFGRTEAEFDLYDANIRREYDWVPEQVFCENRSRILRTFLDRPSIYLTSSFRAKYEEQAAYNLRRSLARMRFTLTQKAQGTT